MVHEGGAGGRRALLAKSEFLARPGPASPRVDAMTGSEGIMRDYTYEILYAMEEDHWWLSSRRKLVLDWIRQRYPDRRDLTILDVGCGTGMRSEEHTSELQSLAYL